MKAGWQLLLSANRLEQHRANAACLVINQIKLVSSRIAKLDAQLEEMHRAGLSETADERVRRRIVRPVPDHRGF